MSSPLKAGAVAVEIIGLDGGVQNTLKKVQAGFIGTWAKIRDGAMMLSSIDSLIRSRVSNWITDFTQFGDQFAKMAQRTGMSAKDLSLIGYAAGQSGSSVEELGGSMKKLQKNIVAAAEGNKSALDVFAKLGIDFQKFQKLSKKDQFLAIAEAVKRIGDETLQADLAMKMFGKSGAGLLPLLQEGAGGIGSLMNEAEVNGIGISDEDAEKAVVLGDTIDRLKGTLRGLKMAFIGSFAEPLNKVLDSMRQFITDNRSMAVGLMQTTSKLLGLGAALVGLRYAGTALMPIVNQVKTLGTILLRIVPTLLSFLSPWGLVRLAILAAVGAFAYFTDASKNLMSWIGGIGDKIKGVFMSAFGDVAGMIQEGRILDAVKLLWLKIQLAFEEGKLSLLNKFNEVSAAIAEPFMAIYDAVMSVLTPVWEWITDSASQTGSYIYDIWTKYFGGLGEWLSGWWKSICEGWEALMNDTGYVIVGAWYSVASAINSAVATVRQTWNSVLTWLEKAVLKWAKFALKVYDYIPGLNLDGAIQAVDTEIQDVDKRAKIKSESIETDKRGMQTYLDDMAARSLKRVDAAKANAPKTNDRIESLKLQISELKKPVIKSSETQNKVDTAIEGVMNSPLNTGTQGNAMVNGSANKQDILGGALAYMQANKTEEAIADNTAQMVALQKETNRKLDNSGMIYS